MGKVIRFKKPWWLIGLRYLAVPRLRVPAMVLPTIFVIVGLFGIVAMEYGLPPILSSEGAATADLSCVAPRIIDGDTFDCGGVRVRLTGIDAPELPGHCREGRQCVEGDPDAARAYLLALTRNRVDCEVLGTGYYGRAIAQCRSNNRDLSCSMVRSGHAEEGYGGLSC